MVKNAHASSKTAGEKAAALSPHEALVEFAIKKGDVINERFEEVCDAARKKMDGGERLSHLEWRDLLSLEYLLKIRATKMLRTDKVTLELPVLPGKGGVTIGSDGVQINDTTYARVDCTPQQFERAKEGLLRGAPPGTARALENVRNSRVEYDEGIIYNFSKNVRDFANGLDAERKKLRRLSSIRGGGALKQAALESQFQNVQRGVYNEAEGFYTFELPVTHKFRMPEIEKHAKRLGAWLFAEG